MEVSIETSMNKRSGGAKVAKSLNVEVGINVEGGCKSCQITKRGGQNKRGGWDFLEKTSTYLTLINEEWRVEKI